jgi:ankyrin repeat protein
VEGADKEAVDKDGNTPLHDAADRGHLDVVQLLLENGASKEARNKNGQTPKVDTTPDLAHE